MSEFPTHLNEVAVRDLPDTVDSCQDCLRTAGKVVWRAGVVPQTVMTILPRARPSLR